MTLTEPAPADAVDVAVTRHTLGFDELAAHVATATPEWAAR